MRANYTEWKLLTDQGLSHFHEENGDSYIIHAVDGPMIFTCVLDIDDVADYTTNYLAAANKKTTHYTTNEAFANKAGHSFDGQGFNGLAVKATETPIAFTVMNIVDFSGIEMINGVIGDAIHMKIRDTPEGAYTGYDNYVLNQYGTNWNVRPNFVKDLPYPARLYPGMVIEFSYKNNGSADRTIYFNLDLHNVM